MVRIAALLAVAVLVPVIGVDQAEGQGFVPRRSTNAALATRDYLVNRPTVSPYLNLLRTQSSLAPPNYQTLVRPANERRQQAARQQASINRLQSRVTNMQGQMAARNRQQGSGFVTGHPSRFMTYLHYYPSLGRR